MSHPLVAYVREDLRDTVRERQAHLVIGVLLLFAVLVAYSVTQDTRGQTVAVVPRTFPIMALLLPLVGIGVFATTITERRTDGSLKVVVGLPIRRGTVVIGTVVARSILLAVAAAAGMVGAAVVGGLRGGVIDPGQLVGGIISLVLVGWVFVAIATLVSVSTRTVSRAMLAAGGIWAVFALQLWNYLPAGLLYVRHGFAFPDAEPAWVAFLTALNPLTAYTNLVAGTLPSLEGRMFITPPAEPAIFEEPAFAFGILAAWGIGTTALARRQLMLADL